MNIDYRSIAFACILLVSVGCESPTAAVQDKESEQQNDRAETIKEANEAKKEPEVNANFTYKILSVEPNGSSKVQVHLPMLVQRVVEENVEIPGGRRETRSRLVEVEEIEQFELVIPPGHDIEAFIEDWISERAATIEDEGVNPLSPSPEA